MAAVQTPTEKLSAMPLDQGAEELDLVALTMAALRLITPWASEPTSPNSWSSEPGTPQAKDRIITLDEVSQHDTQHDCWVVVYDRVYDITTFFDEHPGGEDIMMEFAGQDASTAFRGAGHSRQATRALDRFLIGELPMHERMYRRPGGIRLSDVPD